ncbi:hypothetical protein HN018_24480 (plasmid) [Lichenicola cladoniae]|uniref:Tetratricopeptide repeat protein n=1 Tax=Lichenicola cladoniae TaxID=1484109 RepID=A0A6M8HYR6_9PROT|nr:hypothetical protein [Lichenicola cladoniae]NPD69013.1 hypothetical protein [Acetobacteraceae bacterium]QKE93357.1 hypothetical protein HN018_24480 [Lichenicola cladoniae]
MMTYDVTSWRAVLHIGSVVTPRWSGIQPARLRMLLVAALLCTPLHAGRTSPSIPTSDSMVLEQVPGSRDMSGIALRRLNTALALDRNNSVLAVQVARLDLEQSRKLGDPRYLGRAEAALSSWPVTASATPPDILLLYSIIQQSNHDFTGSLATLARVIAAKPDSVQAWLVRAAVHQAQADYKAASLDCGQVASGRLGLVPDTCTASVMSLTGRATVALRAIAISLQQNAAEARSQPGIAVWTLTLEAETADRLGDPSAETYYRQALAIDPNDPYLLGAWSDWLLDHGRPLDVVALLADRTRIDPLLLRLALAEQQTKRGQLARHLDELEARFDASRLRGETVHRREEARYMLALRHRPIEALALAQANWTVQREPADARILLEAAIAAGRPGAAAPVRAWLSDNGVQDPRLAELATRTTASIGGKS